MQPTAMSRWPADRLQCSCHLPPCCSVVHGVQYPDGRQHRLHRPSYAAVVLLLLCLLYTSCSPPALQVNAERSRLGGFICKEMNGTAGARSAPQSRLQSVLRLVLVVQEVWGLEDRPRAQACPMVHCMFIASHAAHGGPVHGLYMAYLCPTWHHPVVRFWGYKEGPISACR